MATTATTGTIADHDGGIPNSNHTRNQMLPLNTSFPPHVTGYSHSDAHSDVSALDDMHSIAPGSSISMQDEEADAILVSYDRRVPFNQQNSARPSPLRHAELGSQQSGVAEMNRDEITQERKQPVTVNEQPKAMAMNPSHPPSAYQPKKPYPVPPGEDPKDYVILLQSLKTVSAPVDCPRCHERSMTRTEKVSGDAVATWAIVLCCLTGVLCSWIPCVIDECKDIQHHCGNCNTLLATFTNGGRVKIHTPPVPVRSQYAPQPSKDEIRELDAEDNRVLGAEAAGVPVSELPGNAAVRDVGGSPQEIGVNEKVEGPSHGEHIP